MAKAKAKTKPAAKRDTSEALRRAAVALDGGDDPGAITALALAWAKRRSPALAELVELIDARQPEHPFAELVATKADTTIKRLTAADPDDPRLAGVLLDLLEHPKFLTDRAFWDVVLDRLEACADPRIHTPGTRAPIGAIRATLFSRLSPVATRDHVVRRLDAIAMAIREPREPTADEAALEQAIAQRLGGARARRDAEDQILREIYDEPLADGPRLVYADLLSERGDPRGELIALQFERRDHGLDESKKARERWLLKHHMKEWLGGLAPAVSNTQSYSASTFERGFVAIADIYLSAEKQLPGTWREPGWATVEELRGPYKHLVLEHAPLRGLRRLTEVGLVELGIVARYPEKFRHLETLELWLPTRLDDQMRATLGTCEGAPGLRSLTAQFGVGLALDEIAWLVSAPVARRLERLVFATGVSNTPEIDRETHEAVIAGLATIRGDVPQLGVVPPWRAWPRPPPVELIRGDDGTYRRAKV